MRKWIFTAMIAAALMCAAAFSFAQGLAVGTAAPVVDGVIDAAQYTYTLDLGQMTLHFQRSGDTLYIGVVGKTTGWVAVGLGGRMNASPIFIGYFADDKAQLRADMGMGHSHQAAQAQNQAAVSAWDVKEQGGLTTLEIALTGAILQGQKDLNVIYSMGPSDNFTSYHSFRGAGVVPLK